MSNVKPSVILSSFKIAVLYAIFSLLWIFLSDTLLAMLVADPELLTRVQSIKGALFVFVTALLVYLLAARYLRINVHANQRLLEAEQLYRDFIEETDDLVTQVNGNGQITFINDRSRPVLEMAPEECLGVSAFDFIHPEDREQTVEKFSAAIKKKQTSVEFENRQLGRYGKITRVLWMSNIHYAASGEVDSVNSIAHDITRRKQLEETLLQTEKMASVGGLAAGMAHEINNPMAGILQNTQLLQHRLDLEKPKTLQAARDSGLSSSELNRFIARQNIPLLLTNIRESGVRVAKIVTDILDFSRKGDMQMTAVNLPEVIESAIELASKELDLAARFDFRAIEIVRDYAADLPLVPGCRGQLQQVLLNLLQNAAHATLTWPEAERKPMLFLRLREVEQSVEIEIEDNGSGMDAETCRRIFEPFFTTKEVGQGTGLGLFVAYFIITEKHAGSLQVRSTVGSGTCFILRLPLDNRR